MKVRAWISSRGWGRCESWTCMRTRGGGRARLERAAACPRRLPRALVEGRGPELPARRQRELRDPGRHEHRQLRHVYAVQRAERVRLVGHRQLDRPDPTATGCRSTGAQSIDLDGNAPGGVSQTLSTTAGQAYLLSFAYSANPDRASTSSCASTKAGASMVVTWGGAQIGTYTFSTPNSKTSMGWQSASRSPIPGSATRALDRARVLLDRTPRARAGSHSTRST